MAALPSTGLPFLTLVTWTLDRLLGTEFKVTLDGDGNPERMEVDSDYGVLSPETIEEDLKAVLPWDSLEALLMLRKQRTPEQLRTALAELFPFLEFQLGTTAFEKLLRAEWSEIVTTVYRAYRRFGDETLSALIASRIGLGGPLGAELETQVQWSRPDALPESAAQYAVREIRALLPAVVERLCGLQITPITDAVPTGVAQYAREAGRCYLYGFHSAALILCRSCVESGIEDRLVQRGFRKELSAIGYNKVQAMLDLALKVGILDELTFGMANEIRKSANKAVHGAVPPGTDCRERLEQTRAVLRALYE
jgi:hypothetical protein